MYDPSQAVKDLLVAASVGVFPPSTATSADWVIQVSREMASPDKMITIYNTGGSKPNPRWLVNYPSFQVRIRGAVSGYTAAYSKASEVMRTLISVSPQSLGPNSDRWVSIEAIGDINMLHYDENNRPVLTVNFRAIVEPAQVAGDTRLPL